MVSLTYFESESDPVERAKGVILLDESSVVDVASDSEGGKPLVIVRPTVNDPEGRTLFFRVGSLSEAREWQQAFHACRLSTVVGEKVEVEKRLEVSRAETGVLHGTLRLTGWPLRRGRRSCGLWPCGWRRRRKARCGSGKH